MNNEDNQHIFFDCQCSLEMWRKLFEVFSLSLDFCNDFKENVSQLVIGPLKASSL